MTLNVEMITFDCADPEGLAQWWAKALGGDVNPVAVEQYVVLIRPDGPRFGFQRVDTPTPGKNRVHVDFAVADVEAEVKRLIGLGATEVGRHSLGQEYNWVVLADPDGNAFCVAAGE
ncbi:VOC family protein [Mycobacterium hubeiense]|uniref:VOC family protein n=1 Tax=Mycobacterium hubeiense TaxID=1867256 RepID=UPI000C7F4481|nr:VOC family protein [Mycobacterium sp. QGD 101]